MEDCAWLYHWEHHSISSCHSMQGNRVEKKPLPEKTSFYNTQVPHTQSKTIGASVGSSNGRTMMELERLTCYKKKKTDVGDNYQFSY